LEESPLRKTISGLVAGGLVLALAACGSADTVGVKANMGALVGIAMPTRVSERWLGDGSSMDTQFKKMGYATDVEYADDDQPTQIAQINKMIDNGAKLLVISAIDGGALTDVLAKAAQKKVKVLAYDRLLMNTSNVDVQATFDGVKVGRMQGQLLVDRLGLSGGAKGPFHIEIFAGSKDDANAKSFYDGAMEVLKAKYIDTGKLVVDSGVTKFEDVAIYQYSRKLSRLRMQSLLKTYYKTTKVDAVLSPYDGISRGVIDGLKNYGYGKRASKPMPIVSGQDAELASVQRIIAGEQTATIYKDTRELAKVAVQMGNALLTGAKPIVNDTTTYNNNVKKVPTYLLYPVQVDKSNYQRLLVDGGYFTEKQIKTKEKDTEPPAPVEPK
jgi:putative multiple sugar transport system substrate-binding protein